VLPAVFPLFLSRPRAILLSAAANLKENHRAMPSFHRLILFLLQLTALLYLSATAGAQSLTRDDLPQAPVTLQKPVIASYQAPTAGQRTKWALVSTFGPVSLMEGTADAAWGTALNSPKEYGPHWDGFGKRFGMRFTGVAASNSIESGIGAFWGEDPRYFRAPSMPLGSRVKRVFLMTLLAPRRDAHLHPAYARFVAIPAANFLSNTWRVSSDATTNRALKRTAFGFLDRLAGNAFAEFWPDLKRLVFRR
jgi:hypothetical protein